MDNQVFTHKLVSRKLQIVLCELRFTASDTKAATTKRRKALAESAP